MCVSVYFAGEKRGYNENGEIDMDHDVVVMEYYIRTGIKSRSEKLHPHQLLEHIVVGARTHAEILSF